jgi:cysteinyl-tRNA synthetase
MTPESTLVLHDTLAREKRPFVPRDPGRVTLYVCGPTVYDFAHIGNARPPVVFDVLFRVLRRLYGAEHVIYARNVTDVDDKINAKALSEGVEIGVIADRYEAAYLEDMARLNVTPPTLSPHVTRSLDAIRAQIGALIDSGSAYAAEGHVLFDVSSFADYGQLSGRSVDDMIYSARAEVAPFKRNVVDFVLWKPSKPGEPSWESPWGPGRPGWHIECSAMIEAELGLPIDIHGGGHDLIFPHHENELAQGRCAHDGGAYANYWMHNGFLTLGDEKMSKSLGNVKLLHDLVQRTPGEVVRWALLSAHYRAPVAWSDELIANARRNLDRLYGALRRTAHLDPVQAEAPAEVLAALHDDLNTPAAMAAMFELSSGIERALASGHKAEAALGRAKLRAAAELMGVLAQDPDAWFEAGTDARDRTAIDALVQARIAARNAKDFAEADRLRAELTALGIEVMDSKDGATWRFKESAE